MQISHVKTLIGNYLVALNGGSPYIPGAPDCILAEMFNAELCSLGNVHAAEDPHVEYPHRDLFFAMEWGV
jgi:hypothetical protein